MSDALKRLFAPLPPRAIGDQRLTGLHFRVLAAIALHDRMSGPRGGGQGCWAGNDTLARECGCHYTNLSTTVTELGRWGYVEKSLHPLNKRLRVYRVIYNEADEAVLKRDDSLPKDKPSAQIVCPHSENTASEQEVEGIEYIPQKREDILLKQEKDSADAAPIGIGAPPSIDSCQNVGAELAKLERALKSGKHPIPHRWRIFLEEVVTTLDFDDPTGGRAGRLLEEIP